MATSPPMNDDASGGLRRASGRVRKQPETYVPSPTGNGKRKRNEPDDDERDDVEMVEEASSEEDDDEQATEDEPDEEEIREKSRRARKSQPPAKKRPAPKKPRVNGTSLPIRNAGAGGRAKKGKAKQLKTTEAAEAGGLYAEVFAGDDSLETIAARWLNGFLAAQESQALAEFISFILKCAGCDSKVERHDIEDADAVTTKLTDIQDEHQASSPTADYPLVVKGKAGTALKETLGAFLQTAIRTIAAEGTLTGNPALAENMDNWLHTMSSCSDRALRHTATFAALTITTALCEISVESSKETAAIQKQAETERKRANSNKGRVKQFEEKVYQQGLVQGFIEIQVKEAFDAVFIHRYRDIDPNIRRDCVAALGDWITILPDVFLDGQHLRYLGWMLSDAQPVTRGEVVRQLQRLYRGKDRIGGLKTFTERFRSRMVEIATDDADFHVRAAGIELVDLLRDNGLLEPSDVDAVGRLIYDSESRARKAVAAFFAENVSDLYTSKLDELGGTEVLEEVLPEADDDNPDVPRLEWLQFKSLAEMMVAYDSNEPQLQPRRNENGLTLHAASTESRFTLAADVLYAKMRVIQDWQALSGYLLFDHSAGRANGVADDILSQFKHEAVLTAREEAILLEVVSASVKRSVLDMAEMATSAKTKLTKKQKEELTEEQEEAARLLAALIPKLLKKFGDVPTTAAAVLRIESALDLPSMHDLRQDSVAYGALLDDIRKQFMSHGTDEVLGPASQAILHAKSYGELDDVAEEKLGSLWEDVVHNLTELLDVPIVSVRAGSTHHDELMALSNNLLRITRLAHVSNPIVALEDSSVDAVDEASGTEYYGAIDFLNALILRGVPPNPLETIDQTVYELEDEISSRAGEASLRYLLWKLNYIVETCTHSHVDLPYEELEGIARRRDEFVVNIQKVLQVRRASDAVCARLTGYMLDLHTSAVVLKTVTPKPGMRNDWDVLIMDLGEDNYSAILKVFTAVEKTFATLTGKKLEVGDEEEADPVDEDPLSDSDSDSDDGLDTQTQPQSQTQASHHRKEDKQRTALLAERTLCELTRSLIFAIHAGIVAVKPTRARLERNKARLGPNYKELLSYLDLEKGSGRGTKKSGRAKTTGSKPVSSKGAKAAVGVAREGVKGRKSAKSNAIVAEDEDDDEIEDGDGDAEDEEALRRRGLVVEDGDDDDGLEA